MAEHQQGVMRRKFSDESPSFKLSQSKAGGALRLVTELWRGCFPPKPKPLHIFSKKQHILSSHICGRAGFRFVCCQALDLDGVARTVFLSYCGLYLCVLQPSVIYYPSFLSAVKCRAPCESRWSAVSRITTLTLLVTWCGCVVATGRWCGFVSCDVMWISSSCLLPISVAMTWG